MMSLRGQHVKQGPVMCNEHKTTVNSHNYVITLRIVGWEIIQTV